MSLLGGSLIVFGITIFLVGYWFLGKNSGLQECNEENSILSDTYKAGVVTTGIGLLLMIGGLIIFYGRSQE